MDDKPEFKLIIAGGRTFSNAQLMLKAVRQLAIGDLIKYDISIVSGMARGADLLGYQMANEFGAKVYEYPANWDEYGRSAGYIRNVEMASFADGLLAFWDGESRGTQHMIDVMQQRVKPTTVVNY